ncbi:MAG: type I-C CRISPR-associated protein Cas8c/Csd1 [Geobacteraceae bacterium]|nr:type I-C CRISPR-associated protein Cas8c/Csd1 [Geobacteraceae bacterium]
MLLQRLREYSTRIDSTPAMYGKTAVKWIIELDHDGNFQGITATTSGKKNDRGKEFLVPHIGRSAGVKSKLLADNGEYVLGKARDESDRVNVNKRNNAFVELISHALLSTSEPTIQAVLNFYEKAAHLTTEMPEDFDPSHNVTFRVNNIFPTDLPNVQRFWAVYTGAETEEIADGGKDAADVMMCLICGEMKPAVRRLPFKIKRIPNGQTAGNALISANSAAFTSYGLEESLIAPTCADCGERFSKAANNLLEGESTHLTVGSLVYIFWTKEDNGFSIATLLSNPDPTDVQQLIASAFSGKEAATDLDTTKFYASAFSASGARVAVRDWLETTVAGVKRNLAHYFALQRIVEANGEPPKPLGISRLAAATVPLKKEKPDMEKLTPNVPRLLLKCALEGERTTLPMWLLFQAVKRTKAEQGVRKSHAALIKMVLLSTEPETKIKEGYMEQLELTNREPEYLCGRLLRVLESIQFSALNKTNTTIVGRFYGAASSAPASVFGTLLRGAQAHLEKLRKNNEGAYKALQLKLEEVQSGLTSYPSTLTLKQQGMFALGYYHQRAQDSADIAARKLAKAKESTDPK